MTLNDRMVDGTHYSAPTTSFAQDLLVAARENPASTALIGMGVLWMVLGDRRRSVFGGVRTVGRATASGIGTGGRQVGAGLSSVASTVSHAASAGYAGLADAASNLTERAASVGTAAGQQLSDVLSSTASTGSRVGSAASEGASSAAQTATALTSTARSSAGTAGREVVDNAGDLLEAMRERFETLLHQSPLVVGALGIAAGAGLAAFLPRIAAEDALIEPVGNFKDQVQSGLSGIYERASNEARAQGLTPDAAAESLSEVRDRMAKVVEETSHDLKS